jgi:type I restriction-modification system DNA methylase subunit
MIEKEIFEKIKAFVGEENWHQYLEALRGGTLREEAIKVYLFNRLLEREGLLNSIVYYHSRNDFQRNVPDYRYEEGHYKVAIEIKPFAERRTERRRRQDVLLEVEVSDEAMLKYIPLSSYYEKRDVWEQIRNYAETYEFVILTNMVDAYLFHRHGIEFGTQLQKPEHFGVISFEEIFQHIKTQTLYSFLKQKLLHYPLKELDKRFFDDVRHYYKYLEKSIIDVIEDEKERKELIFKLLISLVLARTMEDFLIVPYGIVEDFYKKEKNLFERKQDKFVERFLGSIYDLFWTYYDTEFFEIYNEKLLKQKDLVETLGIILGYEKWNGTFGKGLKFYNFGLLNEDILGGVYEMFLAWLKTDERKEQGIYYTPKVVTEYFADKVDEFLLRPLKEELFFLINEEKWDEAESIVKKFMEIKVIDPACGSGSFLIKVYKKFLESYDEILKELKEKEKIIMQGAQEIFKGSKTGIYLSKLREGIRRIESLIMGRSVSDLREINKAELYKKVAERHIFGIDIDSFAIKLAKLNLLVEALKHGGPTVYGYNKLQSKASEEVFSDLKDNLKTLDSVGCSLDEFLEAFGGSQFDVVLGNPPYVRYERIKPKYYREELVRLYGIRQKKLDYSCYFIMRGIEALKEGGYLMFIITNKWLRSSYGETVREFLKNYNLVELLDFTSAKVFKKYEYDKERDSFKRQNVGVDVVTMIVQKEKPFQYVKIGVYKEEESSKEQDLETKLRRYLENETNRIVLEQEELTNQKFWTLADSEVLKLKEKINKIGKLLKEWDVEIHHGIRTGFNEAFIIDTETKNRILTCCKDEEERERTKEIIKPVLRGEDIERYRYKWAELWIILAKFGFYKIAHLYPAVVRHLSKYERQLKNRGQCKYTRTGEKRLNKDYSGQHHWLELDNNPTDEYLKEFKKEKIIWQEMTYEPAFAYDSDGFYALQTVYIMTGDNLKYLLGILNSKLCKWYMTTLASSLGQEAQRWIKQYIELIPIPPITEKNQPFADQIIQKVQEILSLTQSPDYETSKEKQQKVKELEKEIDQLVYKLYDLTEKEIRLIEQGEKL